MLRLNPAFAIDWGVWSVEACDGELKLSRANIAVGGAIFCLLVEGSLSSVWSADRLRESAAGAVEADDAIVELCGPSSTGVGDTEDVIGMVMRFGGR